jgi:hypothetical protein
MPKKEKKEKPPADCDGNVVELRKLLTENLTELEITHAEELWCDDACLRRYLRAYEGKVDKAWKQLKQTIEWRREMGVAELVANHGETMQSDSKGGKLYITPYKTTEGHPILCMHPAREDTKTRTHDNSLRLLVHNLEAAILRMGPGVEKWVIMISFVKYSVFNAPPMKTSKATLNILMNHYPERLLKAYCCNAPWVFSAFYTAISPFMHPVTKAKVSILRCKNDKIRDKIAEGGPAIDFDQFGPAFYGDGKYDLVEDELWEQYWDGARNGSTHTESKDEGSDECQEEQDDEKKQTPESESVSLDKVAVVLPGEK